MSYARLVLSASTKEALPTGLTKTLPPRYAATPLIQHYLNNIFAVLPIFEESSLYASVDAVYHQDDVATPWDRWTVRMVLAIACLAQSEQRGDGNYSDAVGHVNAALENAEQVLHPGYVTNIQALVLFTIYAAMDPHHFDSWTLIGAASRAMIDIGIHQDPSKNVAVPRGKLELRRRVYWCVYALDRSTSLVQTRAFSFSDEATHVSFPFRNNAASPYSSPQSAVFQQSFDSAIDYFKMREIQSEWYMDLFQSGREPWQDPYPYVWKQYARMAELVNDMPQSTSPAVKAGFELELLYSYVYMLSPSPRIPHIDEYAQRLIFEHCIAYSINLLSHLNKPSSTTRPPVTFYDAMRAYMTGGQFVDVLSRNLNVLLSPKPPSPPPSVPSSSMSEDPLAPPTIYGPPPFPAPLLPEGQITPLDPIMRAINAINDFISILSSFGLRFGFTHWRDRFQRESGPLLAQLYQRHSAQASPAQLSPSAYPPQWVAMPSVSPQAPHLMYPGHPTTPPTGCYPAQSSPFSSNMSYNGNPFDAPGHSPYHRSMSHDSSGQNQQAQHMYTTPSPQPPPDMPQPTEGRKRQALLYGPGMLQQPQQQLGKDPNGDTANWAQGGGHVQHGQSDNDSWVTVPAQTQDGGATWSSGAGPVHGNWG
jgi:hypothetical protein